MTTSTTPTEPDLVWVHLTSDGITGATAWQDLALCAQTDPEAFFPDKGGSTRAALGVCAGCDVQQECLEYALAHDERYGIWGGTTERERRRLRRQRRHQGASTRAVGCAAAGEVSR